jgi:coatomer subunit beta'
VDCVFKYVCVRVHTSLSLSLSRSNKLNSGCQKKKKNTQVYEGHTHYVMHVSWSPKDPNVFASASLDRTVKVWDRGSEAPHYTLEGHAKGVNCVDFFRGGDKPFLITASDDKTVKVWDYQTKSCVQTLEGHTHNVAQAVFHPTLPVILSASEDATGAWPGPQHAAFGALLCCCCRH